MRFLLAILIILCYACNTPERPVVVQETPKALQEKDDYSLLSKRGGGNVLENLYDELIEKDPALKALEVQIDLLQKAIPDSTSSFDKFNGKNTSYYMSAQNMISEIADSAVKHEMERLVKNSLAQYEQKVTAHKLLLEEISGRFKTLQDQHIVLKLARTLPLIEKYQDNNAFLKPPMVGILEELKKAGASAGKLIEGH